jgi:hypothetical protein
MPNAEELVHDKIKFLCNTFKTTKNTSVLLMIRFLINVDIKYEAKSSNSNTGDTAIVEENIKKIDEN